jgi:hypothetical protein
MTLQLRYIKDVIGNPYIGFVVPLNMPDKNGMTLLELLATAWDTIPDFPDSNTNLLVRNHGVYHITMFNVMEMKQKTITDIKIDELIRYGSHMFEYKGIGSITKGDMSTYYVVVDSEEMNIERNIVGLPPRDLHITIGFTHKDLFTERKNVANFYTVPQK